MKRKVLALLTLLLPPVGPKSALLRMMGWRLGRDVRIGHSWLEVESFRADDGVRIGHFNYVRVRFVMLRKDSIMGHANFARGPLGLILHEMATIGNRNHIKRAVHPIVWGHSALVLGKLSKITASHLIDCTRPIRFGDYSILAGSGSQLWTHGYLHAPSGPDRVRIDGKIHVSDNVYIGSRCVINPGISISPSITVGANTCISKSLSEPGLYVGQSLRHVTLDYEKRIADGHTPSAKKLAEKVLIKKPERR